MPLWNPPGDVIGPASAVDNEIVRFDGTTGKLVQAYTSGGPTIGDTGTVSIGGGLITMDVNGAVVFQGTGNNSTQAFTTTRNFDTSALTSAFYSGQTINVQGNGKTPQVDYCGIVGTRYSIADRAGVPGTETAGNAYGIIVDLLPKASRGGNAPYDDFNGVAVTNSTAFKATSAFFFNADGGVGYASGFSAEGKSDYAFQLTSTAGVGLSLERGTITSDMAIYLPNAKYVGAKDSGGTQRKLLGLDGSNILQLGVSGIASANIAVATTIATSATVPLLIGGSGTTQTLTLKTTTGVGAAGADIVFVGGNNGATEFGRFLNSGAFGVGISPTSKFHVGGAFAGTTQIALAGTLTTTSTGSSIALLNQVAIDTQAAGPITDVRGLMNILGINATAGSPQAISIAYGAGFRIDTGATYTATITSGHSIHVFTPGLTGGVPILNLNQVYVAPVTNGEASTSGTITNRGLLVDAFTATAAAGGTVVNTGVQIKVPSADGAAGSTTNRALYINGTGGGIDAFTTTWAIYNDSVAINSILGNTLFGSNGSAPGAKIEIAAGTATAGTAPLRFTSGTLLSAPVAGTVEFLTDAFYGTITTGAARKTFAFLESPSFTTPTLGVASATSLVTTGDIELGHASDTTLARVSAGVVSIEGVNIVTTSSTATLTNKRNTKRVVTASDATSITPNSDNADVTYQSNTQATGTLTINADAGTPTNGQSWLLKIKSTNVQTFSWNAVYIGGSTALPTVTVAGKIDYFSFIYDTVSSKWNYTGTAAGFA